MTADRQTIAQIVSDIENPDGLADAPADVQEHVRAIAALRNEAPEVTWQGIRRTAASGPLLTTGEPVADIVKAVRR